MFFILYSWYQSLIFELSGKYGWTKKVFFSNIKFIYPFFTKTKTFGGGGGGGEVSQPPIEVSQFFS